MKKPAIDYSIYLVTDEACLHGRPLLPCVEQALRGGVMLVQYRSKHKNGGAMYAEAAALQKLCSEYGVPLLINDRVDVALAVGAAGVHLGQEDLPCAAARRLLGEHCIIGISAHNPQEALRAAADGADYLGCGAVFGTASKQDASVLGLAGLRAIRSSVSLPLVGIGGVNTANYSQVLATGAEGAAIISGILAADDIAGEVRRLAAIKNAASASSFRGKC